MREIFKPPGLEEVRLDFAKRGLPESEASRFMNYYGNNGWKVGRNRMKSWHMAAANWKLGYDERSRPPTTAQCRFPDEQRRPGETDDTYVRRVFQ